MLRPRCPPSSPPSPFSVLLSKYFSSQSQLCGVLTVDLTPYGDSSVNRHLPENCSMTACVSKSPSKCWGVEKRRVGDGCDACLCVCVCFVGGEGREETARRKEKLARENKVNEAWRRLPLSGVVEVVMPSRPPLGKKMAALGWLYSTRLLVQGWDWNLHVYSCWLCLLTEAAFHTAQTSSPLPACLSRH